MGKTGLVLEGGGMRGAYTAGVLTWLIDQGIEFDYGVGISAGAMNLCSFAMRNKQYLYDVGVIYMPDKRNVGLNPLFKERHYVGYDFMFDRLLKDTIHYKLDALRKSPMEIEIGLFNLNTSKVEWVRETGTGRRSAAVKRGLHLTAGRLAGALSRWIVYRRRRHDDGADQAFAGVWLR